MEQVRDPIVHRRGRDEQDARTDQHLRERAVAVGVGVSEAMRFVDDVKAVEGGRGRYRAVRWCTQRLMGEDRCLGPVLREERAPLAHQYCWHDERERLAEGEGDCERNVRLAEPDGVGEQGAAVARHDADEPLGGGELVWGEPRRPRRFAFERERREVEQRARPERRDRRRRADRPRREEAGERLGERCEMLREDPWRMRPVHGGPRRRAGRCRQWRRRPRRARGPGRRGCARPSPPWAEAAVTGRRAR